MNYDKSVSIYMYYLCYEDNLGRKQSWQQLKVTAMQVSEQENITCKKKTDKNEGSRSAVIRMQKAKQDLICKEKPSSFTKNEQHKNHPP